MPNLRDPVDPMIKASDLNLHICHVWWNSAPLLGDDFQRACIGTDLSWEVLTVFWHVKNNFGRKRVTNTFGFEWGGSPEEEAINATIHCQTIKNLTDLPGDDLFWGTFEIVWKQWVKWTVALRTVRDGKPLPTPPSPEPPKPVPPPAKPTPVPPPPEAPKPPPVDNGWKTGAIKIGLTLAALAGLLSIASFFVPALAPIAAGLKALAALLSSLGR